MNKKIQIPIGEEDIRMYVNPYLYYDMGRKQTKYS